MPMPATDDWNACAVPWNEPVIVSASSDLRHCGVDAFAPPGSSDTPGARLNDIVTAGTWPRWLIVAAPTDLSKCATADSGTSWPLSECT